MFYDDLPVWGFIGKIEKYVKTDTRKYFLFTHFHFDLAYNEDRVIEISVSSDPRKSVDITQGDSLKVEFSYSVRSRHSVNHAYLSRTLEFFVMGHTVTCHLGCNSFH